MTRGAVPGAARDARRPAGRRQLVGPPRADGGDAPPVRLARIQTPGFEDTGLFARTSGEASDVVHKEMYTFDDRSGRSLTLRPEGTAPIARAYVEHGLHRDPQPVKAYTVAPMYRYGRARPRPLPRALAGVGRGDRHRRPCDRRRGDRGVHRDPPAARRDAVGAAPQLDRRRGLPAGVCRAAERVARRARRRCSARRRCTSARRARCRSST